MDYFIEDGDDNEADDRLTAPGILPVCAVTSTPCENRPSIRDVFLHVRKRTQTATNVPNGRNAQFGLSVGTSRIADPALQDKKHITEDDNQAAKIRRPPLQPLLLPPGPPGITANVCDYEPSLVDLESLPGDFILPLMHTDSRVS